MTDTTSVTPVPSTGDVDHELKMMGRYSGPPMSDVAGLASLASLLAQAKWTIPSQFRNAGDMLNLIMQASALDIAVPTALGNLIFSDTGVPTMRGRLALALIMRAGHKVSIVTLNEREAKIHIDRTDGHASGSADWTVSEAVSAGLVAKQRSPWANYPTDMLFWRALSRAARRFCADVMSGFYLAEEIADLNAGYLAPDQPSVVPIDGLDLTSKVDVILSSIAKTDETGLVLDEAGALTLADETTRAKLRNAWYQAGNGDLMDAIAYEHDGQAVTLRTAIEALGETYTHAVKARKTEAEKAGVQVDEDDGMPVSLDDQAPISTPSGSLPCGCDADTVLVTGVHGCRTTPAAEVTAQENRAPEMHWECQTTPAAEVTDK